MDGSKATTSPPAHLDSRGTTTSSTSSAPPFAVPMSAPAIPNLLSRLGGGPPRSGRGGRHAGSRGGLHGRNHRHGHGGHGGHGGPASGMDHDTVIQSTDSDAALSRMSAVDLGLLDDRFARFFVIGGGLAAPRLPIINRGTYTRTTALDKIIGSFLSGADSSISQVAFSPPRQVVSLGAGTDTRSLRMLSGDGPQLFNTSYHEIDFPTVCERKRNVLQSVPSLGSLLASPVVEVHTSATTAGMTTDSTHGETMHETCWRADLGHGNQLWGHGLDLRQLATAAAKDERKENNCSATLAGLRTDIPTLLVSECCLCYLQVPEALAVLRWFADRIPDLGVVIYEPIEPNDAFGRTMAANLSTRGLHMPTVAVYENGSAQEMRLLKQVGLDKASHASIEKIWKDWVPSEEKDRINELNALDEEEEWQLLASHYMMYVSGETGEPSVEALGMIEEIVRQQVIELLRSCTELAARRGSRSITINDLIFQIRHDAPKVSRLRTFLSWKDVRKNVKDSDDKGAEVDIGGGEDAVGAPMAGAPVDDATKKNKKNKLGLPWEPVSFFNQEVPEREDEEDEEEEEMNYITLQRLRKADERTKAMTKEEYVTWSEYRQASFTYRKGKRFREWAGFGIVTDSKPSDDIVDILGFLTFEMVQTLTEEALRIKDHEDLWKERTGDEARGNKKRKLAQGLFNLPSEGRSPVEPKHIQEAFRRLQARQTKYRAMLNCTRLPAKSSLKIF
ncbi:saga-like transcriptional regulatory complex subunit [Grosmannia clavigera kw1407]|uniref:Leucine carboxyl methyltransferase 1 n=1 Tax=Grosmannia clavigera (strain kw1407 / UAMH 11150) TaxID=655863 RepID=F0XFW1_GROCL|nr:saga-like transcriptional regulatory complex subunit [Grosmannia clavigera kw1407]EFX04162.1 saga-like transcriptional regulatory complex subunit [Grosmannia clavigera kw1407]